ncbi:MAG TPA: hypothetical protein DCX61_06440, partial [Gemmatimonadetes bacterium]|nr:hypothetical protein [Gemmatimonadota bacterium]
VSGAQDASEKTQTSETQFTVRILDIACLRIIMSAGRPPFNHIKWGAIMPNAMCPNTLPDGPLGS